MDARKGFSGGAFTAFKDLSGGWRWLSVTTNKFMDREGEIFSEEAHLRAVAHADANKDYPELWLWHVPDSRIGQADFAGYHDGFVIHSGVFDDEAVAKGLAQAKDLAVSHGFKFKRGEPKDGVFDWYRTFEVSVIPAEAAANVHTSFEVNSKEVKMLSAAKRKVLAKLIGEEKTAWLEERLTKKSQELVAAGVASKSLNGLLNGLPSEEITDWTPRRQEPAPSEDSKDKEMPPSLVESLVADLLGQEGD